MSRGVSGTVPAALLLLLSGILAAPLQDVHDEAVHSVVENLKQVLVASRQGPAHHDEPDVLPIVDVEPTTPKAPPRSSPRTPPPSADVLPIVDVEPTTPKPPPKNAPKAPPPTIPVVPGTATPVYVAPTTASSVSVVPGTAVPITVVPVTVVTTTAPPKTAAPTTVPPTPMTPKPVKPSDIADKVLDKPAAPEDAVSTQSNLFSVTVKPVEGGVSSYFGKTLICSYQ